jgi:hypothetical protein
MIPAFERTKTFHALDRAATVIGHVTTYISTKNLKPSFPNIGVVKSSVLLDPGDAMASVFSCYVTRLLRLRLLFGSLLFLQYFMTLCFSSNLF